MTNQQNPDAVRDNVLIDNTAQGVLNHLREFGHNRANVITRWVWELLQNARDASIGVAVQLTVSIEISEGEAVFQHNGRAFDMEEIAHLIYHGSTKVENEETIGQYGSGFLTTHLLSPQIIISGKLSNGQAFDFSLKREIASPQELSKSMNQAWEDFKNSFSEVSDLADFTTRFRYPVEKDSTDAVEKGIYTLKQCAPLVLVFNQEFSTIEINSPDETVRFKVIERVPSRTGLIEVDVQESANGSEKLTKYILTQGENTSLAIPLESDDAPQVGLRFEGVPKLFLGFPLVRTENFSFPAIINSFDFTPTESRDGVYLGKAQDEVNRINQAVIEEACGLQVNLIQHAASSNWSNVYELADIPPVREYSWLNNDWLQQRLDECFIEPIRQTPAVLCEQGAIAPEDAILPIAEDEEAVIALWDLLNDLKDFRPKLPRREEATGWCKAVKSWAAISDRSVDGFNEAFDGRKLAAHVEKATEIDELRSMLVDDVCAVEWLDSLYAFLFDNELDNEVRNRTIVLDQAGYLDELSNLRRDKDINSEIKRISDDILDLKIREDLRDVRLTSLSDEVGIDYENKDVIARIIAELNNLTKADALSDKFTKASVQLLAWIVRNEEWDSLDDFPAFSLNRTDGSRVPLSLDRKDADDANMPLAPVKAWTEGLQKYADLFPPTQILADDFYDSSPDASVWNKLAEEGIVRTNIIITREENYDVFLPDEPLRDDCDHETLNSVTLTEVVSLPRGFVRGGIIDRVRSSQTRARLFWRFLTEWLINQDAKGLTSKEEDCECEDGAKHNYYSATWLVPIVRNSWVPIGNNKRDRVSAKSLATLFRGSSEGLDISQSDAANAFLAAIRISRFDLMRETIAKDDKARAVMDTKLTNIMAAAQNNPDLLDRVPKFLEQLQDDESLPDYIEERIERKRTVHLNQQLGSLVEDLVKESLENEGFTVKRTHIGADLVIEHDFVEEDKNTEIGLELAKESSRWMVEVKATRDNDVRMTPAQAKNAMVRADKFLLCVVPVETNAVPGLDDVRRNMKFVEKMGERVSEVCRNLDAFEEQRHQITREDGDGVKLVVMSGTTRISVASSVWKDDGFGLDALANRLNPNNKEQSQ